MSEEKQVYATFRAAHGFSDAPSLIKAITWLTDKFAEGRKVLVCGATIIAGQAGTVSILNRFGPGPDYDLESMVGPDGEEVIILKISTE